MATAKRPDKIKFELVKPATGLVFTDDFRKDSIYTSKLLEAVNSDQVIKVLAEDKYLQSQLKTAAKKLHLRLVYAKDSGCVYVKPIKASDQEERLILLLREPRTVDELKAKKLELHVEDTLQRFAKLGTAHLHKGKWVLTETGLDMIPPGPSNSGLNGSRLHQ